ncbi:MAG: 2Fe-2S ferredoxin, partial [Phycisphaeraceae bacterium]|nr:2Fe-2S ferredoxin [Phycisphaeraceae bacterium]
DCITGLQIHTNCDSDNLDQLLQTLHTLDATLAGMLDRMSWINLGGGYLFNQQDAAEKLACCVELLRSKYSLEVFIEPGAGVVRACGTLVATVIDLFVRQGKTIAILDTTVNHLPEVFEYQYEPDVLGHDEEGAHHYLLAGASCLAGDLFGEYSFKEKMTVGQRVLFPDVGAYSLVKANMFNGICLPCVYTYGADTGLVLKRQYTYQDFTRGLIGDVDATE